MREMMALALFCLLMVVVSLGSVAWVVVDTFLDGLPGEILNLDSLLLILICLLTAVVFGFCFGWLARDLDFRAWVRRKPAVGNPKKSDPQP